MKSEEPKDLWRELVEAEKNRREVLGARREATRNLEPQTSNLQPPPGERCQLLLPGWEPITYVREDVHEAELLGAYRRGRCYEAHRQHLLALATFAVGLVAASIGFWIAVEIWLH